jgi:GNAT superfamily N-acetyltransferase
MVYSGKALCNSTGNEWGSMYSLTTLNVFTAVNYATMTFPSYRPLLQALKPGGSIVAIGAATPEQPVGLALAEILPNGYSAKVLSIFVDTHHRCTGIGRELLTHLEQVLLQRGCISANLVYTVGKPTTSALERLLQNCNWNPPLLRMLVCKAKIKKVMEAPWMHRYSLPFSFTTFPWCNLTQDERAAILLKQEVEQWYPEILSPFTEEEKMEPLNSLGLRYQGEVVGWMIAHRIAPDTIRYTSLFVKREFQQMGRAIPLLAEAIKLHYSSGIPDAIWTVLQDNAPMLGFVRRRLSPYTTWITESRATLKLLAEESSGGLSMTQTSNQ